MPFGISSAPEVFQRQMCETVEGLRDVEVVADDPVVVGFGDTDEEAARDHDQNLDAILQHCKEKNIELNEKKVRLRLKEVLFIGHLLTPGRLCVDPNKVQAIQNMPFPKDVAAIQRCFVATFFWAMPNTSASSRWDATQQQTFENLKKAVSDTPVL